MSTYQVWSVDSYILDAVDYIKVRISVIKKEEKTEDALKEFTELKKDFEFVKSFIKTRDQKYAWVIQKYAIKKLTRQLEVFESLVRK